MKKILYIVGFLAIFILHSCKDFLKETDQDKLIPTQVEHYAALLLGEVSRMTHFASEIMTDNIEGASNSLESSRLSYKSTFTWQQEIELDENGNKINTNGSWEILYKKIAIFNYVIEFAENIIGDQSEIDYVVAEALFLRGYFMFKLNNLYGIPYAKESASVDLGVPIRTTTGISQTYDRATVKECYDQILKDLNASKELFENCPIKKEKWHPSLAACNLLLSRVYLYIEDWDNVIEYSSMVIDDRNYGLTRPSRLNPVSAENEDIIYSMSELSPMYDPATFERVYKVSQELIDLYSEGDYRFEAMFSKTQGTVGIKEYAPYKYTKSYSNIGFLNLRVAEAYLNRAEAYAKKNEDGLAKTDLMTLLRTRYVSESQIVFPVATVLNQVLIERRKELCFEEYHRWFDLRRIEDGINIIHTFAITDDAGNEFGVQKFILYPNDKNYTLPIPMKERENNPLIYNNERYAKLPIED